MAIFFDLEGQVRRSFRVIIYQESTPRCEPDFHKERLSVNIRNSIDFWRQLAKKIINFITTILGVNIITTELSY